MRISVVSSLTADDESRLAPAIAEAIAEMLGVLHVAYGIRVETSLGTTVERTRYPSGADDGAWTSLRGPLTLAAPVDRQAPMQSVASAPRP